MIAYIREISNVWYIGGRNAIDNFSTLENLFHINFEVKTLSYFLKIYIQYKTVEIP